MAAGSRSEIAGAAGAPWGAGAPVAGGPIGSDPVMSIGAPAAGGAVSGARLSVLPSRRPGACAGDDIEPASSGGSAGFGEASPPGSGTGASKFAALAGGCGSASTCGGSLRAGPSGCACGGALWVCGGSVCDEGAPDGMSIRVDEPEPSSNSREIIWKPPTTMTTTAAATASVRNRSVSFLGVPHRAWPGSFLEPSRHLPLARHAGPRR